MNFVVKKGSAVKLKSACLVVGVFEGKAKRGALKDIDEAMHGALRKAFRSGEFNGKTGQLLQVVPATGLAAQRIIFVGLGQEVKADGELVRRAVGSALQKAKDARVADLALLFDSFSLRHTGVAGRAQILAEGLLLGDYKFDRYQTDEEEKKVISPAALTILVASTKELQEVEAGIEAARALCYGVLLARDLVNEPGNVKSPEFLAQQATVAAKFAGVKCTVLNKAELEKEKMGALLGVAQGSERAPCMIILEYNGGARQDAPIALVGKGVVFDSGGISIKPSAGMEEMKMDMGGGAAVIGAMAAAALLKLPCNLVGVVPAVENMPSGTAIRPGDILTSHSGKTIEVLNTDAEGRLILADALSYVARYKPKKIIDLATLTGACIVALGNHVTAVLGNDDKMVKEIIAAGERCGERAWQLPLFDDYNELIKSDVADVKNTGGRAAGTITAAAFLQKFVADFKWVHLDIAGTAWMESAKPCYPKGGTGVGVRLLIEWLKGGADTA